MEKKKLKLSISGNTNKTISSIEQAKNQSNSPPCKPMGPNVNPSSVYNFKK